MKIKLTYYIIFFLTFSVFAQNTKDYTGIITYSYQGVKIADIGTKVYFRKIEAKKDWSDIGLFIRTSISRAGYIKLKRKEDVDWLKVNNLFTDSEYNDFDVKTSEYINSFINDKNAITSTVNGAGEYELPLNDGFYEALFISNNLKGHSKTEFYGKIGGGYADILNGVSKGMNWNFYDL